MSGVALRRAPTGEAASDLPPHGVALWAPLAAGALLRCAGLGRQILGGDELHPLRAALTEPLGTILTTYQAPDTYVPFAALCRLVVAAGGVLDERWLRLPGLLAGLALIWLVPRLAAPWIGGRAARIAAWLLALAPPLVLYSRIVRAYAPLLLLVAGAAFAFFRWLAVPQRRTAAIYVALAVLAVVFHPVAGPAALAPLAFALGLAATDAQFRRERWRGVGALALALPAALLLALWPSRASLLALTATRRVAPHYDLDTLRGLLLFDAGTGRTVVAAVIWGLAVWGWLRLGRRQARFASFTVWMFLAQIAGVLLLSPVGAGEPLLFDRYVLVGLPFALLALAAGLDDLTAAVARRRSLLGGVAVAVLLVAWLGLGPFVEPARWTGSFAHHNDFVTYACPRATLPAAAVPAPYLEIAARPGGEPVLEYPWSPVWRFGRALYVAQEMHGRPVVAGSTEPFAADPRVRLRRVVAASPAAFRASGARFVVIHLDPRREELALEIAPCAQLPAATWEAAAWEARAEQGRRMAATLREQWGEPTWADRSVVVWDLVPQAPR